MTGHARVHVLVDVIPSYLARQSSTKIHRAVGGDAPAIGWRPKKMDRTVGGGGALGRTLEFSFR